MDGQRSHGGASRSVGGRDNSRSGSSSSKRRWIPPSSLRRDAPTPDSKDDLTFRKIRGILNKLTPEKFHKLSCDIINVGLDSTTLLKGVILLVFEKALDEPKYCSMYAQLCRRLSEEAPNFDPPDGPCTFNRLLLNKCQDEFEQRRHASEIWDGMESVLLSAEEEEQRMAARRKMVGNLRFIGELGKLEIVHESILHRCIKQLLEKSRRRPVAELAEDLECLSQMMRTCGKVLDRPEAKKLMDQYFERMYQLSTNFELPCRIRFMLQDVLELRASRWMPRKMAQPDGPRTIQQVREEAARDLGVYIPPHSGQGMGGRSSGPISPLGGTMISSFFPQPGSNRMGMEDVFGTPVGGGTLGTGPGVISSQPFQYEANGVGGTGGGVGGSNAFRGRQQQQQGGAFVTQQNFYQNKHFTNQSYNRQQQQNNQFNQQQQMNVQLQQQNYTNVANKELAPRFKKLFAVPVGTGSTPLANCSETEVSLRPSANSMMVKTVGMLPQSALGTTGGTGFLCDMPMVTSQPIPPNQKPSCGVLFKDPSNIVIKQISADKKGTGKKDKGPTKEEWMQRVKSVAEQLISTQNVDDVIDNYRSLKLPERLASESLQTLIIFLLDQDESDQELGCQLIARLHSDAAVNVDRIYDAIKQIVNQLDDLSLTLPRVNSHMAAILGHLVALSTLTLAEVAEPLESGQQFPLFFLVLQTLHKLDRKVKLSQVFNESKVNLLNLLPECDRTKEKLSEILEDRELSFLLPLLGIQSELWRSLLCDPTPQSFYKTIKDTLEPSHHTSPEFISALMTVLVKYITQETTLAPGSEISSASEKQAVEKEKDLLDQFKMVLQAFLHDQIHLQVTAIYAVQVFMLENHFPKGMLLRWFVNLYDLEIVEEEAFVNWKEDLSQDVPGKGKALFQVNQWLTWLQEEEEEEEEDN